MAQTMETKSVGISVKRLLLATLKYLIAPLLLLIIVVSISLLSYRAYLQHKVREQTRITTPNGIDSLEKVTLGGVEQWILIRGWDRSNPVLLFLHGGPGGGEIALAGFFHSRLERHFVVVHWDQRGAGKSYSLAIPADSMNIGQFVADTHELAEMLRKRFDVPKIYLAGHSWGSELGILTAARYPELLYAFVGVAQVVNFAENERITYQFTVEKAKESGNQEAIRELKEIGPPPYDYRKLLTQRKWLEEFGGVFHAEISGSDLWKTGLTSPHCSLADGPRYFRGPYFSLEHMWDEVYETDLFTWVTRIEVPVYFLIGRHDYNTPFELAERYYQQLEAPRGKHLIWFENSAHMIPYEEPEKYCDILINKVLKDTYESLP